MASCHATSLTLYEGLPHQAFDRELMESEIVTKKTIHWHDFPFYERPLTASTADVETLRSLCENPDSFCAYRGPKLCGGFHPDYCLSWTDGEESYDLLICLGCIEVKFFGGGHELLADIRSRQLKQILRRYHDQRPGGPD